MKQLMIVSLLALGAVAHAQSTTTTAKTDATRDADHAKRDVDDAKARAKRDAEDAKVRAQLDEARAELDRKAKLVAELSMKLSGPDMFFAIDDGGPRRAVLGVQIDPDSGKEGALVSEVSPGGAADAGGIHAGDIIVSLDGKAIAGSEHSGKVLVETMQGVKPEQKVKVRVLRAGKNKDLIIVARPFEFGPDLRSFGFQFPEGGEMAMQGDVAGRTGPMQKMLQFRTFLRNDFDGLELARITPKLGEYFGAKDGVLVVSAPANGPLKLEDGDVIQSIDGRKPSDGGHALRILRSYKGGEKLNLGVLRQRKPLTLAVTMPERPEMDEDVLLPAPMTAPVPALPGSPGLPPIPAAPGAGTLE